MTVAFIDRYCAGCHNETDLKGRLDLTSLAYDPANRANFALWVKVHDRVQAGEMPPKDKRPPAADQRGPFVQTLAATLTESEQASLAREGRAVQRRLNRYEYENILRDLLSVPWAQVMTKLPQDGEAFRYNKSGEALDVSHIQMARYLSAADYAMRQAMTQQLIRPETTTRRYYARDEFSLRNFLPRENGTLPDRLSFPVLDGRAQPEVRAGRAPITSPETREHEAVGKVVSTFSDAGGYAWSQFRAPVAGRYRLRFSGYSIWVGGGGIGRWFYEGQGEAKAPVYWRPVWHRPNLDEVWPGRRPEPIGVYGASADQRRPLGAFDFNPAPTVAALEVTLQAGEIIQTDGSRLFRTRVNGTDEQYVNPLAQPDGMPGYAVQWLEVDGPLYEESTGAGYRLLFGPAASAAGARRPRRDARDRAGPAAARRAAAARTALVPPGRGAGRSGCARPGPGWRTAGAALHRPGLPPADPGRGGATLHRTLPAAARPRPWFHEVVAGDLHGGARLARLHLCRGAAGPAR